MSNQLTEEEKAALRAQIAEAKEALHKIMIGGQASSIRDQNGEQVEYSKTNVSELRRYIADLQAELNCRGSGNRRPVKVWMGR